MYICTYIYIYMYVLQVMHLRVLKLVAQRHVPSMFISHNVLIRWFL